jgi:hypothetical protein
VAFLVFGFASCPLFSWEIDVLVYGATPGGIAAAVSAAKGGQEVLLVEPTDRVGGLLTCGLSNSDFRSFESLSGFFWDFSQRVKADYVGHFGDESAQVKDSFFGTHGEPSVNLRVLNEMLAEYPNLRVAKQLILQELKFGPFQRGRRKILSAVFHTPVGEAAPHTARLFIDGTYEGDLMAIAGESYHVGREARDQYNEPLAGDENGFADGQVQGYNLRLIMTRERSNRQEVTAPEGYNREDFVGALRHFRSGELYRLAVCQ